MKERIELLTKLGLSTDHAEAFVNNLAEEAYNAGRYSGKSDIPGIYEGRSFNEWMDTIS